MPNYAGRMSWRALVRYSHGNCLQRSNCNNVIQWSKFHADGCGMVIPFFGVQVHYRQTIMSIDGQPMLRLVLKIFAGWAEPVGAIIAATPHIVERLFAIARP